jgi:hypothetical protein
MTQNTNDGTKIWSAPVLEELTIDLTAIANSGKNVTADNKGGGKS